MPENLSFSLFSPPLRYTIKEVVFLSFIFFPLDSPPMKYFDFELLGIKRKLPFVRVKGRLSLASFVVISDTELVQAAAPELVQQHGVLPTK